MQTMVFETGSTGFKPIDAETERFGKIILNSAFKVHTRLGPGLLESVYEKALSYEIGKYDLLVECQKSLPIYYDGIRLYSGLRIDILVENCVMIELKATEKLIPIYEAQLLTYLKLSGVRLGYLMNFNVTQLKSGNKRMVV